jgi:AcrR family transcriptional regulator
VTDDTRSTRRDRSRNRAAPPGTAPAGTAAVEPAAVAIVNAAVALMFENGFHGTSVRQIAERAGMSVANVYYYFPSKHDLLFRFMTDSVVELTAELDATVAEATDEPAARLAAVVRLFVERHTLRQAAAFVAATELRSLAPEARADIVGRRDRIEAVFRTIVAEGVAAGTFTVADPALAARAILDMGSSVSSWYRPGGVLSGEEVAARYVGFAMELVGSAT